MLIKNRTRIYATPAVKGLTRDELETTLHEVEACINSRPLTFVGDEIDAGKPLTPSYFLPGKFDKSKRRQWCDHFEDVG